jgi:hypothetical protein
MQFSSWNKRSTGEPINCREALPFFSHTKKKQPHNQKLFKAIINKGITLTDFECMEHEDGQRILGFGFFAGIVGSHNGMMAYGKRTGAYNLCRVGECAGVQAIDKYLFRLKAT